MKGIVFNLLEEAVTGAFGPDAWETLLDGADVGGAYTSLGSYPDDEVMALVATAASMLQMEQKEVLRWFGRSAIPLLQQRYPEFFEPHSSARSFILSVNDIIHPEVRKLYAGAGCPHFLFDKDHAGRLLLGYRSPRKLCQLAHGFVLGVSDHYREDAQVEHQLCMADGASMCRIAVSWR